MKKLVSIIVPVFNVEKYLRQCLDSILGQTFNQFEVIIVNDGSTDNSGAICQEYEARDNREERVYRVIGRLTGLMRVF